MENVLRIGGWRVGVQMQEGGVLASCVRDRCGRVSRLELTDLVARCRGKKDFQ